MLRFPRLRRIWCLLAVLAAGCDLLDVQAPTLIEEEDLANAQGAEVRRIRALQQLYVSIGSLALDEGLLVDEFFAATSSSFSGVNSFEVKDRRDVAASSGIFFAVHQARNSASLAIPALRAFGAPSAYVGQMFAVRGFAKLLLAQDFCPGQAFNEVVDGKLVYGQPLTTDLAFQSALQDLDSAVVYAADSARILNFAQVVRARVLLELGRFAEAAAAAAPAPTSYVFNAEYSSAVFQTHRLFNITSSSFTPNSVADGEGGTGLDYVSANDPRVPTLFRKKASDGVTDLYSIEKYPTNVTPIPLATGIEARLIEAEAALQAGDASAWLMTLNDLRATAIAPAMPALADPGTAAARVDLHFRERAFWLFATAHRLGDLRRLVRQYGRTVAQTFPSGAYRLGGMYGTVTTFDIPVSESQNPAVTGCASR